MTASHTEGIVITVTAQADIAAGQFVGANGAPARAANAADSTMAIGTAVTDARAGDALPVQVSGVASVTVSGLQVSAVTPGCSVACASDGRAVVVSSGAANGKALSAAENGQKISVLLLPHSL